MLFLSAIFTTPATYDSNAQLHLLTLEKMALDKRDGDAFVNGVFKDNILLNIAYLSGRIKKKEDINWEDIGKPFNYRFALPPGKTFAFHEDVLPQYKNTLIKTTNARFNYDDGFKSDGYLMGDGVCHLASLIYWVAKESGLDAYAPTNHDFAVIPEISREYGVSIYKTPGSSDSNAIQNLYITNNKKNPVVFEFDYQNSQLKLAIFVAVKSSL